MRRPRDGTTWTRPDLPGDTDVPSLWRALYDSTGGIAWPAQVARGSAWRLDARRNPLHPLGRTGDVRLEIARRVFGPVGIARTTEGRPPADGKGGYIFLLFLSSSGGPAHAGVRRMLHPFVADFAYDHGRRTREFGLYGLHLLLETLLQIGRDGVREDADLLDLVDEDALRRWVRNRLEQHGEESRSAPRRMIAALQKFRAHRHAPRAAKESALRLETILTLELLGL